MNRTLQRAYAAAMLALGTLALVATNPATARSDVEPHYWRQRVFFIPYQSNAQDPQASKIDKVQLLVSRDGGQQWAVLQEADPNVRGFSYHAAADGDYAFALRMSDRHGRTWPEQIAQPLLRVVVDTQAPTIQLSAALDAAGQIIIRYEARDQKLKSQTLRIEVQSAGSAWQRVAAGPPDVSQADHLLGQVAWKPTTTAAGARFRATIEDAAGNQNIATADPSLTTPQRTPQLDPATGPQLAPPSGGAGSAAVDSYTSQNADPPRPLEWPSNNSFASEHHRATQPSTTGAATAFTQGGSIAPLPPGATPSSAGDSSTADVAAPSLLPATGASSGSPSVRAVVPSPTPGVASTSGGWESLQASTPISTPTPSSPGATPPAAFPVPPGDAAPWVNSLTFDLDYDIQTAGPWGVAKVELWGTRDGGRQWQSLGVDQDNRSPMRVTVPAAGTYGFRIVVDGGNGVAAPTPQAGDQPELAVGVDMTPPHVELRGAQLGDGPLAGHLIIRWSATDENLAAHPVGLFSSASAEGPWTTVATDLDNSGEYSWRLGRDVPPRVFVRVEIRDVAGNVESQQTPSAIDLNLPRPTGRLHNVPPVEGDASRYHTASERVPPKASESRGDSLDDLVWAQPWNPKP